MYRAQADDNRPIGKLFSDAVSSSFQTLFGIGVFMMMFSVIIKFITMGAIADLLTAPLAFLLMILHIPEQLAQSIIVGFFEVTQSMKSVSDVSSMVDMKSKIVIAAALVAWGGISVHAQVASIISSTDIRYQPYFIYKIVHAFLAGAIAYVVWEPLKSKSAMLEGVMPVFGLRVSEGAYGWTTYASYALLFMAVMIGLFLFTSVLRYLTSKH